MMGGMPGMFGEGMDDIGSDDEEEIIETFMLQHFEEVKRKSRESNTSIHLWKWGGSGRTVGG
jgi:hypothetical protein